MEIYEVIYGVGGIAYGGYNRATVVAAKKDHIQGLLNEQEGEDVLISAIEKINTNTTHYKYEQVLSIDIA